MPTQSEPHQPPPEDVAGGELPSQEAKEQGGKLLPSEYSLTEQRLVEADKRSRKRLAILARDYIIKFREERQRMVGEWLEEYTMRAASAKLRGIGLNILQAEYIQRYNRLLDHEKQPHSDFFVNLSLDFEDELDFREEDPFDLSVYDQNFEWDEEEYLNFRFIAARHYASRGHWDDAYAYVLRSRPDDIAQHEDIYLRNAQAWHYTNARINELIQEAENALEARGRQVAQRSPSQPLRDSVIPPSQPTKVSPPEKGDGEATQGLKRPPDIAPHKKPERRKGRSSSRSPLSPNKESQNEER